MSGQYLLKSCSISIFKRDEVDLLPNQGQRDQKDPNLTHIQVRQICSGFIVDDIQVFTIINKQLNSSILLGTQHTAINNDVIIV